MLFNSVPFLIFFPIVTLIYYLIPHRFRYIWLLIASYYFYMSWNPYYSLLMMTSTVITYASGLLIDRANGIEDPQRSVKVKKCWVALCFILNLSILFFFKYANFFLANVTGLLSSVGIACKPFAFDILLPVGISFYTFQALSYTVDVYRKDIYAERNILKYALFVSFFPQLVAGPIERSKNLLVQISERHVFTYQNARDGLLLMLWGFFQKLLIADRAAIIVDQVFNHYQKYSGTVLITASVLFAVQIYCDFAGYSNIARGAARVMGFRLMKNFDAPYFSKSIAEFWRRWHISLSSWFRDYLYIPLGGNRKGKWKKYRNILIVFLASGLWHGASWAFVAWGLLHGVYQVIGDLLRPLKNKLLAKWHIRTDCFSYRLGQILVTFSLVDFAWIFFRAPSFRTALRMIGRMLTSPNSADLSNGVLYTLGLDPGAVHFLLLCIVCLVTVSLLNRSGNVLQRFYRQNRGFRWACVWALFFIVFYGFLLQNGGYGDTVQFIYFQF